MSCAACVNAPNDGKVCRFCGAAKPSADAVLIAKAIREAAPPVAPVEVNSPFNCCPALELALERQHPSIGLVEATRITFSTGATSPALAIQFRRGRKGDPSYPRKFDDGSRHADVTYGFVRFCPFCGAKDCRRR